MLTNINIVSIIKMIPLWAGFIRPKVPENRRCTGRTRSAGTRCKKAAIKGGPVCDTHGGRVPVVKAAAKRRMREYVADMVDPQRVLQEAARLAFSDIRKCFDDEGKLLPTKDWPDDVAAAIQATETVRQNLDHADGKTDKVVKLKAWDKPKALEMLAKNLGMFDEKVRIDANVTYKWAGE